MGDNINKEYFEPGVTTFNYNNVTGGADSASGGSGGSGMECLQLRSPPGPFQYLISEQAKSLVALQELQNEVGALLEFRDLVIETFPNLRSKMPPSTPASSRRDWEPGVRVRRKLANGDQSRTKPQPSVQDSGFSTETSCGKDASASASQSTRSRPLEDELWALLDVIQRKGVRLRDEAELLRGELDERHSDTAEESFARALTATGGCTDCADVQLLRCERDALLARAAQLEAEAEAGAGAVAISEAGTKTPPPLGRLDAALETPSRPPRVSTPDSKKFAAILLESNPVELQRQLLTSTVQNQVLSERLRRAAARRTLLLERLERTRELNEDLKFRLEEKSIELEGSMARIRQLEARPRGSPRHCSMRDMEPLPLPPDEDDAPRRRPSRIPLHTANKGTAPRPPSSASGASVSGMNASGASASGISASVTSATPPRPASAHSARSTSARRSAVPVRRDPATDKTSRPNAGPESERYRDSLSVGVQAGEHVREQVGEQISEQVAALVAEYVARTSRLAPLIPRLRPLPADLAYESPQNLALELSKSILYSDSDSVKNLDSLERAASLWNGKPQQYFESMNHGERDSGAHEYDDSLAV